jgi:hypothetical protein
MSIIPGRTEAGTQIGSRRPKGPSRLDNQKQQERHHDDRHCANDQDDVIARAAPGRDEIIGEDGLLDLAEVGEHVNERDDYREQGDRGDDSDGEERVGCGEKRDGVQQMNIARGRRFGFKRAVT